eukprot:837011-Rhodomonas_salina.1
MAFALLSSSSLVLDSTPQPLIVLYTDVFLPLPLSQLPRHPSLSRYTTTPMTCPMLHPAPLPLALTLRHHVRDMPHPTPSPLTITLLNYRDTLLS